MEVWKDIQGYEGTYQVSNLGRVRSYKKGKESVLKPIVASKGYTQVALYTNDIPKRLRVHRLVAETFLSNEENKPVVNHINGIKNDNRLENLEWNTHGENIRHAVRTKLKIAVSGAAHYKSRQIVCIELGVLFDSLSDAVIYLRDNGFPRADKSALTECAQGKRQSAYGYTWKYENI